VRSPSSGSESSAFAHDYELTTHAGETFVAIPNAALIFSGHYHKSGDDLVITRPFESVTIHDYFRSETKPRLVAPDGSSLNPAVVQSLTEGRAAPHYAASEAPPPPTAIGRVETVAGSANVIRNGQTVTLHAGDLVYKGDAVETTATGTLGIVFVDGTTFTLSQNARMVLNDMVYQPGGSDNSSLLSLVQGSITFVAGEVAHTGNMKVETPVATMGIRGTAVHVYMSADNGPTRFSVMREPDGRVGSYTLYDNVSGNAIATVSDVGIVVELQLSNGQVVVNAVTKTQLDFQEEQQLTNQVFQTYQVGQQDLLLHSLLTPGSQEQAPAGNIGGGNSHGSSGPPQTGEPGGVTPMGPNPLGGSVPTLPQIPSPPLSGPQGPGNNNNDFNNHNAPFLPLAAIIPVPATTGHSAASPVTFIINKNTTFEALLPTPSKTITAVQATNGSLTPVSASGTTVAGVYGDLTIASDGTLHYVANHDLSLGAGVLGVDMFAYQVTNTDGSTATATLTFDIVGASNNPIVTGIVSGGTVIRTAGPQTLNLLAGATDPNPNEAITVSMVNVAVTAGSTNVAASNIAYSIDSSGHLTVDPAQFISFGESDSITLTFSYTLVNVSGGATPQTATLTIDGLPSVSYQSEPTLSTLGMSATASPVITHAANDPVHLDIARLTADGWSAAPGGTFTQTTVYGTATLDASGDVTFALKGTSLPLGAIQETFAVPFIDSYGVATSATATFTLDGPVSVSYATGPLLMTSGASSTETPSGASGLTLDASALTSGGWVAAAGGTYTQSNAYGTATLDASGNVTYQLTATPPVGGATESFSIAFKDSYGVASTAVAVFTIDSPAAVTYATGAVLTASGASSTETPSGASGLTLDASTLTSDGWVAAAGGTYRQSDAYGIATLDASGNVTYQLTATPPVGGATESFSIAFKDSYGIASTAVALFTIDSPGTITYAAGAVLTASGASSTETPSGVSGLTLDASALLADGWVAASGGTYTQSNAYGTATLGANGVVTYELTAAPPSGGATESFTVAFEDSYGVASTATAVFTLDRPAVVTYAQGAVLTASGASASTTPTGVSGLTLDAAALLADGWVAASGGTYTQSNAYGTATLDASGNVTYELTATPPAGGATESFTVAFEDGYGVASTATALFTVDGPAAATYAAGAVLTASGVSDTKTPSGTSGLMLDVSALTSGGWVAASGGTYTQSNAYGTATLDANGNVTYELTAAPPVGGATESFTVPFEDSYGVSTTATAVFTIDSPAAVAYARGAILTASGASGTETPAGASGLMLDVSTLSADGWVAASGGTYTQSNAYGTATLDASGNVTYQLTVTPPVSAATESFTVPFIDSYGLVSNGTASFTVNGKNLIVNGGFETGNLTGWIQGGNEGHTKVGTVDPHSGHDALAMGPIGSDGYIAQTIATTPGAIYEIQFWLANTGGANDFTASFGATTLFSLINASSQGYTEYTDYVMATGSTTELKFQDARQDPSYWYLDDVAVTFAFQTQHVTANVLDVLDGGTLSTSSIAVAIGGAFQGYGTVESAQGASGSVSVDGYIEASGTSGKVLDFISPVIGSGTFLIANRATLEFDNSVASGSVIAFVASNGTLAIANPSTFHAYIEGALSSNDVIDLGGFHAASGDSFTTSAVYNSSGGTTLLTVTDTSASRSESVTLLGDYTSDNNVSWTATYDGHGGVNVVDPPLNATASLATSDAHSNLMSFLATSDAPFAFAQPVDRNLSIGSAAPHAPQPVALHDDTTLADNNTMTVHSGDTFLFKPAAGNEPTADVDGANGQSHPDSVNLPAFHFANYQALVADTTIDPHGDVTLSDPHALTLDHVQKAALQSNLFHL
jgi:VCBS repeat-containing protein